MTKKKKREKDTATAIDCKDVLKKVREDVDSLHSEVDCYTIEAGEDEQWFEEVAEKLEEVFHFIYDETDIWEPKQENGTIVTVDYKAVMNTVYEMLCEIDDLTDYLQWECEDGANTEQMSDFHNDNSDITFYLWQHIHPEEYAKMQAFMNNKK